MLKREINLTEEVVDFKLKPGNFFKAAHCFSKILLVFFFFLAAES
jgi:hypothetical protein